MTAAINTCRIIACSLILLVAGCESKKDDGKPKIEQGAGKFLYTDPESASRKTLRVWYYRPEKFTPTTPIVFVMHGNSRNSTSSQRSPCR